MKSFIEHTGHCTKKEYRKLVSRLQQFGLIETMIPTLNSKITYTTVKMYPVYDAETGLLINVTNAVKSGHKFMSSKAHFTIVPHSILLKALRLDYQLLMLLIRLYHYNHYKLFTGVDPNVIRVEDNSWFIHPRIYYDLCMNRQEIIECIMELKSQKFLDLIHTSTYLECFDNDIRYRVADKDTFNVKPVTIISPLTQWEESEDKKRDRSKSNQDRKSN